MLCRGTLRNDAIGIPPFGGYGKYEPTGLCEIKTKAYRSIFERESCGIS